jgi:signal peptidase I
MEPSEEMPTQSQPAQPPMATSAAAPPVDPQDGPPPGPPTYGPPPDGAAPALPPPTPPKSGMSKRNKSILEWVLVLGVALGVALVLRAFVVQTFYIPSPSMVPTLQVDDRVIVNKLSYRLHPVHRKDLVVFTTPPTVDKKFKDLVKRVIGLPGDRIEGRDGKVYINGQPLNEPYLADGTITRDFGPFAVPAGQYYVMGDNRGNSEDSRVFGPIPKSTIVGRAFLRIWPLNRFGFL